MVPPPSGLVEIIGSSVIAHEISTFHVRQQESSSDLELGSKCPLRRTAKGASRFTR